MKIRTSISLMVLTFLLCSCEKVNTDVPDTPLITAWKTADSVLIPGVKKLLTCNDNYVFLTNTSADTVFVYDIKKRSLIYSKALKVIVSASILKGNIFINPVSEYSFDAYDISDIQNWTLIKSFTGLDKGIIWWQYYSGTYDDNYYYWIGHWNTSVQIFEITTSSIIMP